MILESMAGILADCKGLRLKNCGYSLVELIVVVALLGLVVAVLGPIFTAQLTMSRRFEKITRQIDDSSRLQHLLETEISESGSILYNQSLPSSCAASGLSLFSLSVPYGYNVTNGLPNSVTLHYFKPNNADGLYRCGHPVDPSGSLVFSASIEPILISKNIALSIGASSNAERLVYKIKDPLGNDLQSGSSYSMSGVVR